MSDIGIGTGMGLQKTNPDMRFDLRDRIVVGEKSTEFDTYRGHPTSESFNSLEQYYRDMQLYKCIKANRNCSMICVVLLIILIALVLVMCFKNGSV